MEKKIKKILKERCESTEYNVLFVQWCAAKTYVPNILSMIGNIFPHYSLHDATHSEKILSNICRILGEDQIKKLSTTDIWMLLFVAYFHDIGMFVSKDDITETIKDEDFLKYVEEKKQDASSEMNTYANFFEIKDKELHYGACKISSESFNALRFLLADYLRSSHSDRSKKMIKESSFIYVPESIPRRIFDLLADICCIHQKDFSSVMKLHLKENGYLDDDCHPRFIACMLRLGDVLDVDNDRFSSVVLNTLPSIPMDSILHMEKHLSIKTLSVNATEILLEAHCNSIEVGEITNSWFKWIADEIDNQTKNWHNIIPFSDFAPLPLVKQLNVRVNDYDAVSSNGNYKFSFDSSKALSFIQGSGFYQTKFIFVRELLQNATDATYLRVFSEKKDIVNKKIFDKECKNYPINFSITENKEHPEILQIVVKDLGIGIDKGDFESILNSGKKNRWKNQLVKNMLEWMKPSGAFGIGLHSIFSLTDSFKISTTKKNGGCTIEGIVFSPTSKRNGSVYLKSMKAETDAEIGSTISFDYKSNKIPNRLTLSSAHPILTDVFHNYDFINAENTNFELAEIVDEVCLFAYVNNVPIILNINGLSKKLYMNNIKFNFFDEKFGIEFNVQHGGAINRIFYRNQLLKKATWLHFDFFHVDVNVLSGDANEILLMNRDDLKEECKFDFCNKLNESLINKLREQFKVVEDSLKPNVAMFLDLNGVCDDSIIKYAKDISLNKDYTIDKVLKLDSVRVKRIDRKKMLFVGNKKIFEEDICQCYIKYIEEKLKSEGYYLSIPSTDRGEIFSYSKQKPKRYIFNNKQFVDRFIRYQSNARCLLPCESQFEKLKLKKDFIKSLPFGRVIPPIFNYEKFKGGYMIFPYKYNRKDEINGFFELDDSDSFYDFVKKNAEKSDLTLEEIKSEYAKFKEVYDSLLPHA